MQQIINLSFSNYTLAYSSPPYYQVVGVGSGLVGRVWSVRGAMYEVECWLGCPNPSCLCIGCTPYTGGWFLIETHLLIF